MMHRLYHAITWAGGPLISHFLKQRMKAGKEDAPRFGERKGIAAHPRPTGGLVWLHGASVGEALSMLPLVECLNQRPGLSILVTTGTVSSARLLAERLPPGVIHQYIPVDRPAWVKAFLDHWRPDLVVWAESDFWPNMLSSIGHRRIPLILIQGRVSPRSFAGWKRAPAFIRRVLSDFALCLAQTPGDAERLTCLGAPKVECLGNLKLAVPPLPHDPDELDRLRGQLGDRPVWLAASTHDGEEVEAARLHHHLASRFPGLTTLIIPRHPHRAERIQSDIAALGLSARRRSQGDRPDSGLYLADTMGEMGLFYRLSPIAFVGKSLGSQGGQNPFEPARLGAAVLFGPHMGNFPDMAAEMVQHGAAIQVQDWNHLELALSLLLSDSQALRAHRQAALEWASAHAHVLDTMVERLSPWLDTIGSSHARP